MIRRIFLLALVFLFTLCLASECFAVGKYSLAYWRELGCSENHCPVGNHIMTFWVWDEQGNPKSNVQIYTTWDVLLGATDADGRVEVVVDVNNDHYECKCVDAQGSVSDITPWMTSRQSSPKNWGHISYEIGYMFKSNQNNPGTYDTSICGTVNTAQNYDGDAPRTWSLAYYSTNCLDHLSDEFQLSSWVDSHGQTFVATGDRVTAVEVHGAIGANYFLSWTAEILDGGPTGTRVGGPKSIPERQPNPWVLPFGVNQAPVIPGHTYYLKITRSGGLNTYTTNNNYANGNYYLNGVSQPTKDLQGLVCCMTYGSPQVHITSGPTAGSITQNSAVISWVTDVASTSRVDYGTTTSYGQNQYNSSLVTNHSISLTGLTANTTYHYKVTSTAAGYADAVSSDYTFATSAAPGSILNPGFESQDANWTRYGQFDDGGDNGIQPAGWYWGFNPHSGLYFAGSAASWGKKSGGFYQQVSVIAGTLYKFTSWIKTFHAGSGTNDDTTNRVGIDPTGGTNSSSTNIVWSPRTWATDWSNLGTAAVAAGSTITVFIDAQQRVSCEWNLNAFDDTALAAVTSGSIAQAKVYADGTEVGVVGRVVTAGTSQMGGAFYIEESSRLSGIRVVTGASVAEGDIVNVTGVLGTANGERYLTATAVSVRSSGNSLPAPLAMTNKDLGGKDLNQYAKGVTGSYGPNNVGLLVETWGRVTSVSAGYCYIKDTSRDPIKVDTTSITNPPSQNQYVVVKGICRLEKVGSNYVPVIKPRKNADMMAVPE